MCIYFVLYIIYFPIDNKKLLLKININDNDIQIINKIFKRELIILRYISNNMK